MLKFMPLGAIFICAALPASAQTKDDFRQACLARDTESCSSLIASGTESDAELWSDYLNRGADEAIRSITEQNIGSFTAALADANRAIDDRKQAVARFPNNPISSAALWGSYNNRAWIYHLMGRDIDGLPDANQAVALAAASPSMGTAAGRANSLETRAEIYEKLGRPNEAISDYRMALSFVPSNQDAQNGLARLGESLMVFLLVPQVL